MVTYVLKDDWNPWWTCQTRVLVNWSVETSVTVFCLTLFGAMAGFGLTSIIQSTVSLHARKHIIRTSHFFAGFIWIYMVTVCNPWTYVLIIGTTYLWGSEPYDNVFSKDMWIIVMKLWRSGDKVHLYWAISSLVVHAWFLMAAAAILVGLYKPAWIIFAIFGFSCSHIARVFAYDRMDRVASFLEILGVMFLVICVIFEVLDMNKFRIIWLSISTFERMTHLPAAFKGDAGWMRSYDLWLAAQEKSNGLNQTEVEEISISNLSNKV